MPVSQPCDFSLLSLYLGRMLHQNRMWTHLTKQATHLRQTKVPLCTIRGLIRVNPCILPIWVFLEILFQVVDHCQQSKKQNLRERWLLKTGRRARCPTLDISILTRLVTRQSYGGCDSDYLVFSRLTATQAVNESIDRRFPHTERPFTATTD